MKTLMTTAQRVLLRAVRDLINHDPVICSASTDHNRQLPGVVIESVVSSDWASLTFVGEHHRLGLRLPGRGAAIAVIRARLDECLVAADVTAPGLIVAEIAVVEADVEGGVEAGAAAAAAVIVIEALTLHD